MPHARPHARKKKTPKRVLALPDLEHAKSRPCLAADVTEWTTDLRSCGSEVRPLVLLGTLARVQTPRRAPVPNSP